MERWDWYNSGRSGPIRGMFAKQGIAPCSSLVPVLLPQYTTISIQDLLNIIPTEACHSQKAYIDSSIDVWSILYPEIPLPDIVNAPRFGQFAASGSQIRARPKSDYERAHDWLMTTDLISAESGRVFEYTWHVMFGQDPFL